MSAVNMVSDIYCVPGKTFYINGMTTSIDEAQDQSNEVARIIQQPVELHHNNTTPSEKVLEIATKAVLGIIGLTYVVCSQKNSREKQYLDTAIGAASAALILWALYDYSEIQHQKNESSTCLANKVSLFLCANPLSHVTLIFHSQGADIGQKSLLQLTRLRDRINVITIGGMVDISDSLANRVMNFQNMDDLVSRFANLIFDNSFKVKTKVITDRQQCETFTCHEASNYISNTLIQSNLQELTRPDCYLITYPGIDV